MMATPNSGPAQGGSFAYRHHTNWERVASLGANAEQVQVVYQTLSKRSGTEVGALSLAGVTVTASAGVVPLERCAPVLAVPAVALVLHYRAVGRGAEPKERKSLR